MSKLFRQSLFDETCLELPVLRFAYLTHLSFTIQYSSFLSQFSIFKIFESWELEIIK